MHCDICGTPEARLGKWAVDEYQDCVRRCQSCASIAAHEKYIPPIQQRTMTKVQRKRHEVEWEHWLTSLSRACEEYL